MDKILQTFRNLYSGENVVQKHLMYLLILLMPAFSTTAFNMIEKNNQQFWQTLIMLGVGFGIVAIPMAITALGVFVKFIHEKFEGSFIFPEVDIECLKKGFKTLPIFLCWVVYWIIIIVMFLFILFVSAMALKVSSNNAIGALLFILLFLVLLLFTIAGTFLVSPFVNLIFVKFAKDYQYKAEYFNPITPFKYMAGNFKPLIMLALKYILVSFVVNISAYIIVFLAAIILGIIVSFFMGGQLFTTNQSAFMLFEYIVGACGAWILSYVSGVVNLAYVDNMTEYYLTTLDNQQEPC